MDFYRGQLYVGIGVLVVYMALLLFTAKQYVRRSNQRWLQAHVEAAETRLDAMRVEGSAPPAVSAAIKEAFKKARTVGSAADRAALPGSMIGDWIGSCEIAGWVRLHEAQRLEVALMSDVEVQARFARAMGQVDELTAARQAAWLKVWSDLQLPAHDGQQAASPDRWRAELCQLLAELFNARDATYNQLVGLYGKAGLLVAATYLPVAALLVAGYGPVLLAGLIGGLLSRLQRLVYAQDRPTTYGTSWVPLFLAPLLGALAAWTGLHLLALTRALGILAANPELDGYRLQVSNAVLGLALLFGFSERLLNQVGKQAEQVIAGDRGTASSVATGPSTAPTSTTLPVTPPLTPPPTPVPALNGLTPADDPFPTGNHT